MALKNGNVPESGVKELCIGREKQVNEFEKLLDKVDNKKAIVKFINGEFGAGKSFFLKVIEEMAYDKNFVVSWITLSNDIPFNKIDIVYKNIVKSLKCKTGTSLSHIIDRWITGLKMEAFEETSNPQKQNQLVQEAIYDDLAETREHASAFAMAIESYNKLMNEEDYKTAEYAKAWLRGDSNIPFTEKRKFGVKGDVTKENAIHFLEALSIFVKSIGYSGLVVLIDEVEFTMNLHTKKLRDVAYNYMRDIYDNCNLGKFENSLFVFAATPELFDNQKKGIPSYEALIYISKSLDIDSSNYESWATKGEIFRRLNKNREALHCFDLSLQINPKQSKTWTKRGFLLINRYGQFIEAINSFDKGLELNPKDKNAIYFKAEAYFALKNYKKALGACDDYLKITSANVFDSNVYSLKTKILMILNNFEEALAVIDEGLKISPDDDSIYATKAMILLRAHKYDEGIECVNKALKLNPSNVIALKLRNNILR